MSHRASSSWARAHSGKRRHRTWLAAFAHALKVRIRYRDRLYPYKCFWGDDGQPRARPHYHAGHAPGHRGLPPPPGPSRARTPQPGRQILIGFNQLQLSTLRARAANHAMPWQQYAAKIIHDALAAPVPRPWPDFGDECPVCKDTYHDLAEHLRDNVKGCGDIVEIGEAPCPCGQMTTGDCLGECVSEPEVPRTVRCPVHAEPIGDGRHCIACDGGVF